MFCAMFTIESTSSSEAFLNVMPEALMKYRYEVIDNRMQLSQLLLIGWMVTEYYGLLLIKNKFKFNARTIDRTTYSKNMFSGIVEVSAFILFANINVNPSHNIGIV